MASSLARALSPVLAVVVLSTICGTSRAAPVLTQNAAAFTSATGALTFTVQPFETPPGSLSGNTSIQA